MINLYKNKGITLIALVVTIIYNSVVDFSWDFNFNANRAKWDNY